MARAVTCERINNLMVSRKEVEHVCLLAEFRPDNVITIVLTSAFLQSRNIVNGCSNRQWCCYVKTKQKLFILIVKLKQKALCGLCTYKST